MTHPVKRTILICAVVLIALAAYSQSASSIIGQWKNEKEPEHQIEFYLDKDGFYYGKVLKDFKKDGKEMKKGSLLFKKLTYDAATNTFKGLMSPPDAGIEVNSTISFDGNDKLKVVGKKFMMTKTLRFVRIK